MIRDGVVDFMTQKDSFGAQQTQQKTETDYLILNYLLSYF